MTTLKDKNSVLMARLERRLPLGITLAGALIEARNWVIECGLASHDIETVEQMVSDMSDYSILRYIQKNFAGGICGFILCIIPGEGGSR